MAQWDRDAKRNGYGFNNFGGNYFILYFLTHICNVRNLENTAVRGERSVLTLGSLCLPAMCKIQREAIKSETKEYATI